MTCINLTDLPRRYQDQVAAQLYHEPHHSLGRLAPKAQSQRPGSLDCAPQAQRSCPPRPQDRAQVIATLIAFVNNHRSDNDNSITALKPMRDAVAAELGVDDADPSVRWQYAQAETRGAEGVLVMVEGIASRRR